MATKGHDGKAFGANWVKGTGNSLLERHLDGICIQVVKGSSWVAVVIAHHSALDDALRQRVEVSLPGGTPFKRILPRSCRKGTST